MSRDGVEKKVGSVRKKIRQLKKSEGVQVKEKTKKEAKGRKEGGHCFGSGGSVSFAKQREEESVLEVKYLAFLLFLKARGKVKGWCLEV